MVVGDLLQGKKNKEFIIWRYVCCGIAIYDCQIKSEKNGTDCQVIYIPVA